MELSIDPEFRDLLRPLSNDESMALEKSILSAGKILSKICVWRGMIVDGHHRYSVALKYGVPFETEEMDFESREDAMRWIVDMQSARRNMEKVELKELRKKVAELLGQGDTIRSAAGKLGIASAKVYREKARHDAIQTLAPEARDLAEEVESVSPERIRNLSRLPKDKQKEILEKIRQDPKKYRKLADLKSDGFSTDDWNAKFVELAEMIRESLFPKNIPDCQYLTPDAKSNVVAYAEALVSALEDCLIVSCPRCISFRKPECKCCGGAGLVIKGIARVYGGRD